VDIVVRGNEVSTLRDVAFVWHALRYLELRGVVARDVHYASTSCS
jgi:hypothetical protein